MQSFLLPALLGALLLQSPTQTAPRALDTGKVRQVRGKYVFFHNQPLAAYDVAFSFTSSYTPSEKMTINDVVNGELAGAVAEAGEQLKPFDAIIIQAGSTRDVAIKFKESAPAADRPLATVNREAGKYLFVYCDPTTDYDVLKSEKVAWFNKIFGGAYYSTAQVEVNLTKAAQKNPAVQGIIFGETAAYISFKK
jgi:hypothetical protein